MQRSGGSAPPGPEIRTKTLQIRAWPHTSILPSKILGYGRFSAGVLEKTTKVVSCLFVPLVSSALSAAYWLESSISLGFLSSQLQDWLLK